jgi:predicted nucleic acid-binding protein
MITRLERYPRRLRQALGAGALARGRPRRLGDAQIAAIAQRNRMAVASRDIGGFEPLDVPVVNPWQNA